ncbi:OLC1v1020737C1 [Oldenlandia corymbosa var. corymbosa]|uniref:OLC1v1020737C1 n=1 Tax=Oldenlandia corymbosa var. corymbosa TaxID=529605 RepID=A0AAV1BU32_OLDCO|nr:OLC1v1020737C1 [Oldenlandia corymbosa var. corymbosa]
MTQLTVNLAPMNVNMMQSIVKANEDMMHRVMEMIERRSVVGEARFAGDELNQEMPEDSASCKGKNKLSCYSF